MSELAMELAAMALAAMGLLIWRLARQERAERAVVRERIGRSLARRRGWK